LIDKKANFPASVCAAYHRKLLGADEVEMLLVFFSLKRKRMTVIYRIVFPSVANSNLINRLISKQYKQTSTIFAANVADVQRDPAKNGDAPEK
jgi:hypothetical protein